MSIAITNVDNFFINWDDGSSNQDIRKTTVDFDAIDGNYLPMYFDKRPVNKGRGLYLLDYTDTTVSGQSPSSAAELQTMIEALISQTSSIVRTITTVTAPYNILASDDILLCDGTFDMNLFTAAGNTGKTLDIKNEGSGEVNVICDGVETIDGDATVLLVEYEEITIISDGTIWHVI